MTNIIRPKIGVAWLGTVDQGKQLEINADLNGNVYSLATIVADGKDESLWFEIYVEGKIIQIPLEKVKEVIEMAPGEVHSEEWYEKNVYPDEPST